MDMNEFFKNFNYFLSRKNDEHKANIDIRDLEDAKLDISDIPSSELDLLDAFFDDAGRGLSYEAKLPISSDPVFDISIKVPEPVHANFSILDKDVSELVKMDRDVVRVALLTEIDEIKNWPKRRRNAQLQKIFGKIIDLEPTYKDDFLANNIHSHTLFVDLLSTPGLSNIPFVYNFLKNDFSVFFSGKNDLKRDMIITLFDYYNSHSKEAIDTFNYILSSSNEVALTLLDKSVTNLDRFFSERILKSFDKEDLSQLFRFYFRNPNQRKELADFFREDNKKVLFLISEMTKKVKTITGHGAEFIESAMSLFVSDPNFKLLLEDIYDKVVNREINEERFSKKLATVDDFVLIHDLINYIVMSKNDAQAIEYNVLLEMSNSIYGKKQSSTSSVIYKATTLEEFIDYCNQYRKNSHMVILGEKGYDKFVNGKFNPAKDFPKINSKDDLLIFKEAYLYNVYGISIEEARHLKEHYSKYLDKMDGYILEEDRRTFEVLKAINRIYDLDIKSSTFKEELRTLQYGYYQVIKRKGLNYQNHMASSIIIEGLLNRMFMNTYNDRLMRVQDAKVIGVDDGVTLIEPAASFDIILTSFSGAGEFYSEGINMAEKWNTSALGYYQGLCASHISNSNLGVIDLDAPIIGFANIPKDGLNAMGSSDIFSDTSSFNLRKINDSRKGNNRYFIPGHLMSSETRYGYNEIVLDRFLMTDPNGKLKLQPDYVVYYKLSEDDVNDKRYQQSLKVAKDFNIPIVVIDVKKIKAREKQALLALEEKLLSNDKVNPNLMMEIVTRYMDNYTGALSMKPLGYDEDFSVGSMRRFFNLLIKKIDGMEEGIERQEWIDALEKSYEEEKRKYREAKKVTSYKMSVKNFILRSFDIETRIVDLKENEPVVETKKDIDVSPSKDGLSLYLHSSDRLRKTFYNFNDFTQEKFVIVELFDQLQLEGGSKFSEDHSYNSVGDFGVELTSQPAEDKEIELIENLLISYFYDNCENTSVTDLTKGNQRKEVVFASHEQYDWNRQIMMSPYRDLLDPKNPQHINLNPEKVEYVLNKLDSMSEKRFLGVFKYVAESYEHKTGVYEDVVCRRLLDKKSVLRDSFDLLIKQTKAMEIGEDPLDINTIKKH